MFSSTQRTAAKAVRTGARARRHTPAHAYRLSADSSVRRALVAPVSEVLHDCILYMYTCACTYLRKFQCSCNKCLADVSFCTR